MQKLYSNVRVSEYQSFVYRNIDILKRYAFHFSISIVLLLILTQTSKLPCFQVQEFNMQKRKLIMYLNALCTL